MLFLDPRLSGDHSRSCASCHPGGGTNNGFYANGIEVEAETAGSRRVPTLRGVWQTPPYLWDGSLSAISNVLDRMLSVEMGGPGLAGPDRDALEAYVLSIPLFDNGRLLPDGAPVEPAGLSARRGAEVFKKAKCDVCHRPPSFSRRFLFDVGTGGKWSVPTLRNLKSRPRLGHDGRWADVETAVDALLAEREVELTPQERQQILSYLELF
jgi:cytochrome c peroxidase